MPRIFNPASSGGGGGSVTADAPLSGSGTSGSHLVVANASGAAVGVIQLAGDIGGTATVPTVVGLSHVTNGSLPASGIAAVNPSSLTGTGTVPIGGIPTGSSSSTVAIGNDSRLSDARTPTVHGSTHYPGGTDDIYALGGHAPNPAATTPNARIDTFFQGLPTSGIALSSGLLSISEFTAPASVTLKGLGIWVTAAAVVGGGSITHSQLSLYTVAAGVYTLVVASTDDTTGSFLTATGLQSKTIADTAITKGTRYAIGVDAVFSGLTTAPSVAALPSTTVAGFYSKSGFPTMAMQVAGITTVVAGPYTGVATTRCHWMYAFN